VPTKSPLYQLINSSVLIEIPAAPGIINGKYTDTGSATRYLIRSYLQRIEGTGTSTGQQRTFGALVTTGGGATNSWLLRGYGIEYYQLQPADNFVHGASEENFNYSPILVGNPPSLAIGLLNNARVTVRHGNYPKIFRGTLKSIGGKYQGEGPDKTIYYELQGIPVSIGSSEDVT